MTALVGITTRHCMRCLRRPPLDRPVWRAQCTWLIPAGGGVPAFGLTTVVTRQPDHARHAGRLQETHHALREAVSGRRWYASEAADTWRRLIADSRTPEQLRAVFRRLRYKHPRPQPDTLLLLLTQCSRLADTMEKAEVPVSTRSRVAANTSNAARMRAQLLEVVRDIHKHLDLSGSLGSYGALLAAYADCGTSVDVCKVLAQMQAAGCWPDLANYEVVVRVYAREGALPEALAAIHQAKGQLAGRLRVERWLRGALWIGGGMLFIKWAGMAAASILGPEARSVVWIGAGVLTMTLAARVIAGFWVHPDALRTRQSGNATLTTTITASAITPNHAGDSLLLLSAHDIDDYLQTVAANSLLQHWDTAMAHQVCGALEASDSVQRWLTDGATQHGTPIWLQRLCDGLLPQRSADAWEVSRMAGNKAGQPLLSPDTLLALLDALRVAGDVHRAQEAAKLAALLDVPVPDATRSWIDQQSKHSSLTTALLQAQAKLPTKRQKLRQIKKSHGDKH